MSFRSSERMAQEAVMKTIKAWCGSIFMSASLIFVSAAWAVEPPVILDVRTPAEFQESHLDGAKNIDFLGSDFQTQIGRLDRNKSYVLYCRSGNRSGQAEKSMKAMGFKKVKNVGSLKEASKTLKVGCGTKSEC